MESQAASPEGDEPTAMDLLNDGEEDPAMARPTRAEEVPTAVVDLRSTTEVAEEDGQAAPILAVCDIFSDSEVAAAFLD